jgi:hypothetical protein
MERRGFIKTSLVTMVAGASGHSALGEIVVPMADNITQTEMKNFIREMDVSMDRIFQAGGNYLRSLIPQTPTEDEQNFFRSGLRSLMLVGNFGDLPIKGQVHPWMQKRMLYSAPEINFSVTNSFDILRNMSDESKEEIRSILTDDPGLGSRILETLDLEARSVGVPAARRRQMRVMGTRIIRRMRHSPEMLIDEYVKKADKLLLASNSDEALEQILKIQMGNDYTTRTKEAESAALQWEKLNVPAGSIGYDAILHEQGNTGPTEETDNLKTKKGLGLLGIGVILTAAGWIIIGIAPGMVGAVLGITVGPILILIALIAKLINSSKS